MLVIFSCQTVSSKTISGDHLIKLFQRNSLLKVHEISNGYSDQIRPSHLQYSNGWEFPNQLSFHLTNHAYMTWKAITETGILANWNYIYIR